MLISVRKGLALATTVFIILVIAIAALFSLIANNTLEMFAHDIGHEEMDEADEVFNCRLNTLKHQVDATTSGALTSGLWASDPVKYNSTSVAGVDAWFNDTSLATWATDIYGSSMWHLGRGLQAFIPQQDGISWHVALPQVYYDTLADGTRSYVLGYSGPGANTKVDLSYYTVTNSSTTAIAGTAGPTPVVVKELQIHSSAYSYTVNTSSPFYTGRANTPVGGVWEPIRRWVSPDNSTYHYFSYISEVGVLPNSNNGTIVSTVGWLGTLGIFAEHDSDRVGTILVVDSDARILTTTSRDLNQKLRVAIATARETREGRNIVTTTYPEELGANFPDEDTRTIFNSIYPSLASLGPYEVGSQNIHNVGVDDRTFFVDQRVLHAELGLFIVWYAPRDDLTGDIQRTQLFTGIGLSLLAILIAAFVVLVAYVSVVGPLRHLSLSMEALSELKMERVDELHKTEQGKEFSVAEVQSLYQSYKLVKETMKLCLPYVPQEEGDLHLGMAELNQPFSHQDEALSSLGSSIMMENPMGTNQAKRGGAEFRNVSLADSMSSAGAESTDASVAATDVKEKPVGLFAVMSVSMSTVSMASSIATPVSVRGGGSVLASGVDSNSFSHPQGHVGRIKTAAVAATVKRKGLPPSATTSPMTSPLTGLVPSKPSSSQSNRSNGSANSNNTLLQSAYGSINKELVLRENAVVAHFRLRPDVKWFAGDLGVGFRDLSYLLQHTVTKMASEHKGTVFLLGSNQAACVWAGVAQPEKKAVQASTEALEVLLEKGVPMLGGHDLTVPIVTVGVVRGAVLLGTTGTPLKRSYTCEGPAVQIASILSHVGCQIRAHILTDTCVQEGSSMFAELRPVEEIKLPKFWSSFINHPEEVITAWECIGFKGSVNISTNLAGAKSKKAAAVGEGGRGGGSTDCSPAVVGRQQQEQHQHLEWMYQLEAHEKAEAKRLSYAVKCHTSLKAGDLSCYRANLREWVNHCFMENDLFLMHRRELFCIDEGLVGEEAMILENVLGASVTSAVEDTITAGNAPQAAMTRYFDDLNESGRSYSRNTTVEGGVCLPFES